MHVWKLNEGSCQFEPSSPEHLRADMDGTYIVRAGDRLSLHEGPYARRIPSDETLIYVAGLQFGRDCFEYRAPIATTDSAALVARGPSVAREALASEMRRHGAAMRRWMQACSSVSEWVKEHMLTAADEAWWQIDGLWADSDRYLAASLALSPDSILPILSLDLGSHGEHGQYQVIGTITAIWQGDRVIDPKPTLFGQRIDVGAWWQFVEPWHRLPMANIETAPLD